jgi:hypothetical protein
VDQFHTGGVDHFQSGGTTSSELPVVFPLGPVLLAGWLATVVAFVLNVK